MGYGRTSSIVDVDVKKLTASKIEANTGRDREHERVLAPVRIQHMFFRRNCPRESRFHVKSYSPDRIKLDSSRTKKRQPDTVFLDISAVKSSAYT